MLIKAFETAVHFDDRYMSRDLVVLRQPSDPPETFEHLLVGSPTSITMTEKEDRGW